MAERDWLRSRVRELEEENTRLKERLGEKKQEDVKVRPNKPTAMQTLTAQEKIGLFRSLFKGRENVYARRWYSKTTGKAGYQPVCSNEWNPKRRTRT